MLSDILLMHDEWVERVPHAPILSLQLLPGLVNPPQAPSELPSLLLLLYSG